MRDAQLHLVETLDDVLALRSWLGERREWLAVDLETTGLNVGRDRIRLAQLGDTESGWAVPWERWGGIIHELLPTYDSSWIVAHNWLFDSKFLKREGIVPAQHLMHDTMIMSYLASPMTNNALKSTARRLLGPSATAGDTALKQAMSKQGWTWETVPIDLPAYWAYGALDTVITARVAERLWPRIAHQRLIYEVELGAIHAIRDAELAGMLLDMEYVHNKRAELVEQAYDLRIRIPLDNPGSDAQVIKLLEANGNRLWRTTEKGNTQCDETVLLECAANGDPHAATINEWRKKTRLVTSYFDNFIEMNVEGVLRCSVKPVGARTGRMSITQPALQTLPRGPIVRDAFVAREGHTLVMSDYDQLELRVLAHLADETEMLEAIHRGEDLHSFVAEKLYGAGFTKEQRQRAKNGNFAKGYGAGTPKFAETAGIPLHEAEQFMVMYDQMFPGIARYTQEIIQQVVTTGHVVTVLGRVIPVERDKAYVGVNYVTQSSATADLIKLKIIECAAAGLGPAFRLPVHDELIFEVPDDELEERMALIEETMTETQLFKAPCTASPEAFKRWGDKYREKGETYA